MADELVLHSREYQIQVLSYMLHSDDFKVIASEVLQPEMFSDRALQWFFTTIKDSPITLTRNTLKEELLKAKAKKLVKKDDVPAYVEIYSNLVHPPLPEDKEHIRKNVCDFVKMQNVKRAIMHSFDLAKEGKWDEVEAEVSKAINSGQDILSLGYNYFQEYESRIAKRKNDEDQLRFPTGIAELNEATNGGLGPKRVGLIVGGTGRGKAQPNSEPVLTPNGYKTMGDIKVGDYVIGSDGSPTKVLGVFPQGLRPVAEVEFSNGEVVRCDWEHLWTFRGKDIHKGFKTKTLREWAEKPLKKKSGKHYTNTLFAPMLSAPAQTVSGYSTVDPYTLGAILGCENELMSALRHLGVMGKLSVDKEVPACYSSPEQRLEILRGLFDTDGHPREDGSVDFCVGSEKLRDWVAESCELLGGTVRKSTTILNTGPYKGNEYYRARCELPWSICPFKLTRHKKIWDAASKQRSPFRAVVAIRDAGYEEECTCIQVAAADSLYVTSRGILTHNTLMLQWLSRVAVLTGNQVIYYTLELPEEEIAARFDSMWCKIRPQELKVKTKESSDILSEYSKKHGNSLIIKEYNPQDISIKGIEAHYKTLCSALNIRPRLVLIDYLDLLKPVRYCGDPLIEMNETVQHMCGFAKRYDVGIWTATQLNRAGLVAETPDEASVSGSISKLFNVDLAIFLAQTSEERELEELRLIISKNRLGKAGGAISIDTDFQFQTFMKPKVANESSTSTGEEN